MKILKNSQVTIYAFVLMLMVAGYFNYTEKVNKELLETSIQIESKSDEQLADIGDAVLVNSNDVENKEIEKQQNAENIGEAEEIDQVALANAEIIEYFTESKLERDKMYSEMISTYENVLENPNSTETQKESVVEEITKISNIKSKIMICENLLGVKGFEEVLIFLNDNSVNVIIKIEELSAEQVAQIQNIISREMDVDITNIHISNKSI